MNQIKNICILFVFLISSMIFVSSCEEEEPTTSTTTTTRTSTPTVTTSSAQATGINSGTSGGNVTDDGGENVTERGIVWNTGSGPTVESSYLNQEGSGEGSFTSAMTNLTASTTYYVRAYAINSEGTSYGNELSFTTLSEDPPSVTTSSATDITYSSATIPAEVTDQGTYSVTERGIVYATFQSPTLEDASYVSNAAGTGSYSTNLESLNEGTTYYARGYATSSAGTSYGNQISFSTVDLNDLSFNFDGTNDYVYVEDRDNLDLTTKYTLEAWIKLDDKDSYYGGIVGKLTTSGSNGYLVSITAYDEIYFDGLYTNSLNLEAGKWYHVAAVNDYGTRSLYINGSKIPLLSGTASFTYASSNTDPLTIGSYLNGNYFDGNIDEVRVWNAARTETEIQENMNESFVGNESDLAAYFPMKSTATDGGYNSDISTCIDITGNGDGILTNAYLYYNSWSNWASNYEEPTLTVGDSYLGGKIIYIDATGYHGIICSFSDLYNYSDYDNTFKWSQIASVDVVTSSAIGEGRENTDNIIDVYGTATYAAYNCNSYTYNNFNDWYLPSSLEVKEMYKNYSTIGGFTNTAYYWTSTDYDNQSGEENWHALVVYFGDGVNYYSNKTNENRVRPVRSF